MTITRKSLVENMSGCLVLVLIVTLTNAQQESLVRLTSSLQRQMQEQFAERQGQPQNPQSLQQQQQQRGFRVLRQSPQQLTQKARISSTQLPQPELRQGQQQRVVWPSSLSALALQATQNGASGIRQRELQLSALPPGGQGQRQLGNGQLVSSPRGQMSESLRSQPGQTTLAAQRIPSVKSTGATQESRTMRVMTLAHYQQLVRQRQLQQQRLQQSPKQQQQQKQRPQQQVPVNIAQHGNYSQTGISSTQNIDQIQQLLSQQLLEQQQQRQDFQRELQELANRQNLALQQQILAQQQQNQTRQQEAGATPATGDQISLLLQQQMAEQTAEIKRQRQELQDIQQFLAQQRQLLANNSWLQPSADILRTQTSNSSTQPAVNIAQDGNYSQTGISPTQNVDQISTNPLANDAGSIHSISESTQVLSPSKVMRLVAQDQVTLGIVAQGQVSQGQVSQGQVAQDRVVQGQVAHGKVDKAGQNMVSSATSSALDPGLADNTVSGTGSNAAVQKTTSSTQVVLDPALGPALSPALEPALEPTLGSAKAVGVEQPSVSTNTPIFTASSPGSASLADLLVNAARALLGPSADPVAVQAAAAALGAALNSTATAGIQTASPAPPAPPNSEVPSTTPTQPGSALPSQPSLTTTSSIVMLPTSPLVTAMRQALGDLPNMQSQLPPNGSSSLQSQEAIVSSVVTQIFYNNTIIMNKTVTGSSVAPQTGFFDTERNSSPTEPVTSVTTTFPPVTTTLLQVTTTLLPVSKKPDPYTASTTGTTAQSVLQFIADLLTLNPHILTHIKNLLHQERVINQSRDIMPDYVLSNNTVPDSAILSSTWLTHVSGILPDSGAVIKDNKTDLLRLLDSNTHLYNETPAAVSLDSILVGVSSFNTTTAPATNPTPSAKFDLTKALQDTVFAQLIEKHLQQVLFALDPNSNASRLDFDLAIKDPVFVHLLENHLHGFLSKRSSMFNVTSTAVNVNELIPISTVSTSEVPSAGSFNLTTAMNHPTFVSLMETLLQNRQENNVNTSSASGAALSDPILRTFFQTTARPANSTSLPSPASSSPPPVVTLQHYRSIEEFHFLLQYLRPSHPSVISQIKYLLQVNLPRTPLDPTTFTTVTPLQLTSLGLPANSAQDASVLSSSLNILAAQYKLTVDQVLQLLKGSLPAAIATSATTMPSPSVSTTGATINTVPSLTMVTSPAATSALPPAEVPEPGDPGYLEYHFKVGGNITAEHLRLLQDMMAV